MNAPETGKTLKAQFHWDDPLLLDQQLTEDERMVRDAAAATPAAASTRGCSLSWQ